MKNSFICLCLALSLLVGCTTSKPEPQKISINPSNTETYWKGAPHGKIDLQLHMATKILFFVDKDRVNGWSNLVAQAFTTTPGVYYRTRTEGGNIYFANDFREISISATDPQANILLPTTGFSIIEAYTKIGTRLSCFDAPIQADIEVEKEKKSGSLFFSKKPKMVEEVTIKAIIEE